MAFGKRTQQFREQREAERKRRREETRRQAVLERRQEEERERQRQEARRLEALREWQEVEASLEAARLRREALLAQLRAMKQAERREAERQEQRRAELLTQGRTVKRRWRQEEASEALKEAEVRQRILDEKREERERTEEEEERRARARQERLVERRSTEQVVEQANLQRQADRQAHSDEQRQREQAESRREAEREARRREQRQTQESQERHQATRQARRDEEREADRARSRDTVAREEQRQAEQAVSRREAEREARRREQRQTEESQERRQAALQARRDEEHEAGRVRSRDAADREEQRQAEQAESRREAEREARRREQRQTEENQERRQAARQARRDEEREADRVRSRNAARELRQQESREERRAAPPRPLLQDRIASGVISGALPWLRVSGNRIVTLAGNAVTLRGVSLLGLDSAAPDSSRGFAAGAGITPPTLDNVFEWGANVFRLAINRDRVINGFLEWSAWDYLADLDWIIQYAAARGAYTILSLRRLDDSTVFGTTDGETPNYIAPQPDYDTIGMWRLLGERYADEPAVLFDLYTSPHAALADDLTGFDTDWTRWTLWVQMMVAELRRVHPKALCLVCGLNWGTDMSGFPVIGTGGDPIPNLVYAAQLFPQRANPWPSLDSLGQRQPLFISEWGGLSAHLAWGERTALHMRAAGIGWTAAHWNGEPFLVRISERQSLATGFGAIVRRELALTGEPSLATQPAPPPTLMD